MLIEPKDIKAVMQEARESYEIGCDTVYARNGRVDPKDLHFCMGVFDVALFYHDHPMDAEDFSGYGVRDLYEAAVLIHQKRVDEREYIIKTDYGESLIDLGGFITRRALAHTLPLRMSRATWAMDVQADPKRRASAERHMRDIMDDLEELCQSPSGKKLAAELWQRYAPEQKKRPDFLPPLAPYPRRVGRAVPQHPRPAGWATKNKPAGNVHRIGRAQRRRPR